MLKYSMSLSGRRIRPLRRITPRWVLGLLGGVAAAVAAAAAGGGVATCLSLEVSLIGTGFVCEPLLCSKDVEVCDSFLDPFSVESSVSAAKLVPLLPLEQEELSFRDSPIKTLLNRLFFRLGCSCCISVIGWKR